MSKVRLSNYVNRPVAVILTFFKIEVMTKIENIKIDTNFYQILYPFLYLKL